MAVSLGGIGIWCMHFVGMSAMNLKSATGDIIYLRFDSVQTILSLISVILLLFVGLFIGSRDVVYGKTKTEIIEMFIDQSKAMSFKQIQNIKNGSAIAIIIGTKSLSNLIVGALFAATGVCVMHFVGEHSLCLCGFLNNLTIISRTSGMNSIVFRGKIVYNPGIVAAAVIIALVASVAAFWILFRFLSIYPHMEVLRIGSALAMTVAVSGMHYAGMQAATFYYEPNHREVAIGSLISSNTAYLAAVISTLLFVAALMIFIMADLRAWVYGLAAKLHAADDFIAKLEQGKGAGDISGLLSRYHKRRGELDALDRARPRSHDSQGQHSSAATTAGTTMAGGPSKLATLPFYNKVAALSAPPAASSHTAPGPLGRVVATASDDDDQQTVVPGNYGNSSASVSSERTRVPSNLSFMNMSSSCVVDEESCDMLVRGAEEAV